MSNEHQKRDIRTLKIALLWRLVLSAFIVVTVVLGVMFLVKHYTEHGKTVSVPNLYKRSLIEVYRIIDETKFTFEVLDSSRFNPRIPPFSVIDQNPKAGKSVKSGRKIYLTINPSGFRKTKMPNIIQVTRRNAIAMLHSSRLEEEGTIYVPNIGRDMVLAILFKGDTIPPGESIPEMSKVVLICGDGHRER